MTQAKRKSSDPGFLGKTTLKKAGGSLIMTVPASARNLLGLVEGQEMAVRVVGNAVVAEPVARPASERRVRRPKYSIEELVAGMEPDAAPTDDERRWTEAPPAGRELW